MGRVPKSLLIAVRDMAVVALAALTSGWIVLGLAHQRGMAQVAGLVASGVTWWEALTASKDWTLSLLAWAFVIWCASRSRAGSRTAWLPGLLGAVLVTAGSATTLGCIGGTAGVCEVGGYLWPGPAFPQRWNDGSLDPGSAAWTFPLLAAGLLVLAAALGLRAGRLPDDGASRRITAASRPATALAVVVLGLPATAAMLAATLAWRAAEGSSWRTANMVHTMPMLTGRLVPLALALIAAVLLSGTGPLGLLATAIVALPVVAEPFRIWLSHGWSAIVLGETTGLLPAIGLAVVVVAVALWRPAAAWAGTVLGPARVPATVERAGEAAE